MLFQMYIMSITLFHFPTDYSKATFSLLLIGVALMNLRALERTELLQRLEQDKDKSWQELLKRINEKE